jgi:endonuclease/exonuclease/phosphatase family metal-dependent hydrolase
MLLILKEIEAFLKQEHSLDIPMLIMGDFNSEHDSGVYELLSKGKVLPSAWSCRLPLLTMACA